MFRGGVQHVRAGRAYPVNESDAGTIPRLISLPPRPTFIGINGAGRAAALPGRQPVAPFLSVLPPAVFAVLRLRGGTRPGPIPSRVVRGSSSLDEVVHTHADVSPTEPGNAAGGERSRKIPIRHCQVAGRLRTNKRFPAVRTRIDHCKMSFIAGA